MSPYFDDYDETKDYYKILFKPGVSVALCLVFPPQGTQLDWRVIWECWIPGDNMQERIKTDHIPYDVWAKQGWITVTEGNVIDYTVIESKILEMAQLYRVIELDSDRAMATMLLQRLEQAGITCVDIPQTYLSLTDPLNQIEILLKGKAETSDPEAEKSEEPKMVQGKPLAGRIQIELGFAVVNFAVIEAALLQRLKQPLLFDSDSRQ